MSQQRSSNFVVNYKAKEKVKGACCNRSILSPCALEALGIRKRPTEKPKYIFNSVVDNDLTNYLGIMTPFLGADIASSIIINKTNVNSTYLWFLGDTFYGNVVDGKRDILVVDNSLIWTRNSILIWTINNDTNKSSVYHYMPEYEGQYGQNKATYGFFSPIQPDPNNPTLNYWPINALIINNNYYIICEKVICTNLTTVGIDILQLNITDINNPSLWTYEYKSSIPTITTTNTIGNTSIVNNGYVYLFGSKTYNYYGYVTRIPINDFIDGKWSSLEIYNGLSWLSYLYSIPKTIFTPLALTSTIIFNTYLYKYMILSIDWFSVGPKVCLFYSSTIEGPWEGPEYIYDIPSNYLINNNILYYAPFFHQEFQQNANEIYWSYNINSFNVKDLVDNLFLYTPKVIKTIINIEYGKVSCY